MRAAIGPDVDLLVDCHSRFTPAGAREVAARRAELEGAVCVLGSATPSLESFQAALALAAAAPYMIAIGGVSKKKRLADLH